MQRIIIASFLLMAINFDVLSQNNLVGIELDPAPYVLKGYSISLKYSSKKMQKVSIMGSIFASDFPDGMMKKINREKGGIKSVTLKSHNKEIELTTLYPNLRIGYIYYPFKNIGFYINPWINFGSEINANGPHSIDIVKFEPAKFHYIVALHFGYSIFL